MRQKRNWTVAPMLALALALLPPARPAQAATYTVTNTNDSGAGSLRQAIIDANSNAGADTISFNISCGGGVCTIQPTSALPDLTDGGTTINGYSQPGASPATGTTPATLKIQIDGTNAGSSSNGFRIISANNVITGLVINRFGQSGVLISGSGATSNTVSGNHIGTDADGTTGLGNTQNGASITNGAQNNTIGGDAAGERNVISGNGATGVVIEGSGTTGNTVSGNYIGTDANGTADLGNSSYGVSISDGAQNNTVGGATEGERNLISGNGSDGVHIYGSGTTSNTVSGNYIGVNITGTLALGNSSYGVSISYGPQNNIIGGDTEGERNVISGNNQHGVAIFGSGTTGNTVSGNRIGTDAGGAADLGNLQNGVYIADAQNNTIGGDAAGEGNLISGNNQRGVVISGATGNTVSGNRIGANASGTADLGNSWEGVHISDGAQNNTVGGDTEGERNLISGNDGHGVEISGSGTTSNTVSGNRIGTDANGTADLGNAGDGVYISNYAQNNTVGGDTAAGQGNLISGNNTYGVEIYGSGTTGNTVSGNRIGTNITGTLALGNSQSGVSIGGGAQNNTVGGATEGERNLISGNNEHGVSISGSGTTGNTVSGNYIGTDAAGTADLGNSSYGVSIGYGAQSNTIGGDAAGERNAISGNGTDGVSISGSGTTSNTVSGNFIGVNTTGTAVLSNTHYGISIEYGAQNNTVGGDTEGERNVISGNGQSGVLIGGSGATGNTVSGNHIGVNITGTLALGNSWDGVTIGTGAQNNTVGGDADGERNVISGNGQHGVSISGSGATGNTVSGNRIGTDANGAADLGNSQAGVYIGGGADNNTVGGNAAAGQGNLISGNNQDGVRIENSGTMSNTVSGNTIGADVSGTADLGNSQAGVYIGNSADNNTVGGDAAAGQGNLISGNNQYGVYIAVSGTTGNTVSGNLIGLNITGTLALGNSWDGVYIFSGAQNNTIGGDTDGERNVISGNGWGGVRIASNLSYLSTGNTVSGNYIGTDAAGTADRGNTQDGVRIHGGAQNNTVGGDAAGEGNLISGNNLCGVEIYDSDTTGNVVSGNRIGTDANGAADLGNTRDGVYIYNQAQNNTIGGDTPGERNVISGNDWNGVQIYGSGTTSNTVSGNHIGTDAAGTLALSNTLRGVLIFGGAQNNTVGPDNLIAHNNADGVEVNQSSTTGNAITRNSIYSNTMGIDLVSGANGNIAAPVIVTTTAGSVNIVGTACAGCTVEVFANSDTDGEGETYLGSGTATGGGAFTVTVSSLSKPYLTATATKVVSGTSEFSAVFTSTVTGGKVYLPIILRSY